MGTCSVLLRGEMKREIRHEASPKSPKKTRVLKNGSGSDEDPKPISPRLALSPKPSSESERAAVVCPRTGLMCAHGAITDDYELFPDKKLGSGMAGIVYVGKERATGQLVAVKTVHRTEAKNCGAEHEAALLQQVRGHPNVVELRGLYADEWDIHMVQDLCDGGELFDVIMELKPEGFTEDICSFLFRQIIAAIKHCHDHGICHRDIKPENLLFLRKMEDKDPRHSVLKLVDFGLGHDMETDGKEMHDRVGSQAYVAPEIYQVCQHGEEEIPPGLFYGPECDIWSAGVILYILLKGRFPFANLQDAVSGRMEDDTVGGASPEAHSLVHGLLTVDPRKRITAEEALAHPWMNACPVHVLNTAMAGICKFHAAMTIRRFVRNTIAEYMVTTNAAVFGDEAQEEFKRLHEGFKKIDTGKTGTILLQEFVDSIQKMGYRLDQDQTKAMLNLLDTDHSGTVSFHNFVAACMSRAVVMNHNNLHRVFAKLDSNKDGLLNKAEFSEAFPHLSTAKLNALIAAMDTNNDGVIDYEEFRESLIGKQIFGGCPDKDDAFKGVLDARRRLRGMIKVCTGVW